MDQVSKVYIKQIRTGKVKHLGTQGAKNPMERPWKTGMFKNEQSGKLWLSPTGLESDEIGDTVAHGGPEKALFAYPEKHYNYWKKDLEMEINTGAMGENLVIEGIDETDVCIGDTYEIGDALVEVSQPRQPCWKPARRFGVIDFALRIQKSGRTGWYYRVLKEGYIEGDSMMVLKERPYPEWTIQICNQIMHERKKDLEASASLAACPLLAPNWKRRLDKRLEGRESRIEKRVYGPNKDTE
ncbi:MAG TPA: MOSC domain-containing protein [Pseudogracilibacillus sp.]|nr:MOSC domain-containing protein [Pseudogracilibacillus sp.]